MDWKKCGKALLFPHPAIMILLLPVATLGLIGALVYLDSDSVAAILAYLLAFYTLLVWCMRFPRLVGWIGRFRQENRLLRRWQEDDRLRMQVSLYGGLVCNTGYALLHLGMGIWHRSFWFGSLAAYYLFLAGMRFFLVRHKPGRGLRQELRVYRTCGIVFLGMNLAIALMIFFMVYWNRTFLHHEITTIALAAYTFASLTMAILNLVRDRTGGSPVASASRTISLAAACVSILTLESTMLTTFGEETMDLFTRRLLLASSGGAISLFIIAMAVYMIRQSTKKLKEIAIREENPHGK